MSLLTSTTWPVAASLNALKFGRQPSATTDAPVALRAAPQLDERALAARVRGAVVVRPRRLRDRHAQAQRDSDKHSGSRNPPPHHDRRLPMRALPETACAAHGELPFTGTVAGDRSDGPGSNRCTRQYAPDAPLRKSPEAQSVAGIGPGPLHPVSGAGQRFPPWNQAFSSQIVERGRSPRPLPALHPPRQRPRTRRRRRRPRRPENGIVTARTPTVAPCCSACPPGIAAAPKPRFVTWSRRVRARDATALSRRSAT